MSANNGDIAAIQRERKRLMRGRVLEALVTYRKADLDEVETTQLVRVIPAANEPDVRDALEYLCAKQYVEDATVKIDHRDTSNGKAWRITPAGIDLVDGTTEDAAITFG